MTIQVKHVPRKQVIISEISQYDSFDEMIETLSVGPPNSMLPVMRWVDGIVLTFLALQTDTDFMAKERARGVLYWDHVSFAPMPEYQPTIMTQNGSRAYITKVEKNETFIAIGKFLKKKLKK